MELDPSHILQVGMGFWPSKTVLSAVELQLFTHLGGESLTGEELGEKLGLHPRATDDFLDTLVALRFLERDGDGSAGRYRNTAETAAFLDKRSPNYIGGILEMSNARLYRFWGDLTEALQTGKPQNEVKHTGTAMFEELYSDQARLEQFMDAMKGISAGNCHALAEMFDFSKYKTVCDVGGATGQLCAILASRHPHLQCTSYDLPAVAPIAERAIAAGGPSDRVAVASGDFFADPLPQADVITMGLILHDWNLDRKMQLIRAAYEALPDEGAFIIIENLIDDAPARERVRADDVPEHADRVRRRVRLHRRRLRRLVPGSGLSGGRDHPSDRSGECRHRVQVAAGPRGLAGAGRGVSRTDSGEGLITAVISGEPPDQTVANLHRVHERLPDLRVAATPAATEAGAHDHRSLDRLEGFGDDGGLDERLRHLGEPGSNARLAAVAALQAGDHR
jgi:hypothetical protein